MFNTSTSSDNRESCGTPIPSSCIAQTGVINDSIRAAVPTCKPNINDVTKAIQDLIDATRAKLGDNTTLTIDPIVFPTLVAATSTQKDINQVFLDKLLIIDGFLENSFVDPNTVIIAMDLLCLIDPSCTPQTEYTLTDILTKLVTNYCDLLTRVQAIETLLNI